MKLEPARLPDVPLLAEMSRALIERGLGWRWTGPAIERKLRDAESEVVVARDGGAVVGFALAEFHFARRDVHLLLLAVDPASRRAGVGRALVEWIVALGRRGGIERIALEVRERNRGARAFYRALGFREVRLIRGYYREREDAVAIAGELRRRR